MPIIPRIQTTHRNQSVSLCPRKVWYFHGGLHAVIKSKLSNCTYQMASSIFCPTKQQTALVAPLLQEHSAGNCKVITVAIEVIYILWESPVFFCSMLLHVRNICESIFYSIEYVERIFYIISHKLFSNPILSFSNLLTLLLSPMDNTWILHSRHP